MVNGPGSVILAALSVLARKNSMSLTSTGWLRRRGPTTRGYGRSRPLGSMTRTGSGAIPSSAVANRLE
jgi:hypothetical protein